MDAATVRAEIKSWERAFKAENRRDPTVDDVKAHPEIAIKYKLYKKLSKQIASSSFTQNEANGVVPSTPPRRTSALPGPSSLVPKSRATSQPSTDATPNPFSPAKSPRRRLFSPNEAPLGMPNSMKPPSTPPSKKRAYSTPSPEPVSPVEVAPKATSPFLNSAVSKARKRLRGDMVSPSPKKPRMASARRSPGLQNGSDDDGGADASYIDDSPVKPASNGKDFKLLFEEERLPRPSFSSVKKGPFSRSKSVSAPFDSHTNDMSSRPIPEEKEGPTKKVSTRSIALPSLKTEKVVAPMMKSLSSGKQPYGTMTSTLRDISSIGDNVEAQDTGSSRSSRKRSSSVDANELTANDHSFSAINGGLLPPSPPPSGTTQSGARGITGKGQTKNRKKAKMITTDGLEEDCVGDEQDLQTVDFDLRSQRRINPQNIDDEEDDTIREGFGFVDKDRYTGTPEVQEDESDGGEPEVNLPENLRKLLHISSSRARAREERALVDSLLQGKSGSQGQWGEVWGIGETEDATATITDGEDDWAGEGIPWEVGEL